MEKSQLLALVISTRAELDACLTRIEAALWDQAKVGGEWTARDILAHITWHEREMIELMQTRTLAGSPLWDLPLDERNAIIQAGNSARLIADVRVEALQTFQQLLLQLETLQQADLDDAARFAEMPPDWSPADLISGNTWEHYQEHTRDINKYMA